MVIPATFALGACVVTVNIENGYFIGGTYSNPYPFPLNFQVIDMEPDKGDKFVYSYVLQPFSSNVDLGITVRKIVYNMYARIMFVKN